MCVGVSHLKLLLFGFQGLLDKLVDPQSLQLHFLTRVHQLVLQRKGEHAHALSESEESGKAHHKNILSSLGNKKILSSETPRRKISRENTHKQRHTPETGH